MTMGPVELTELGKKKVRGSETSVARAQVADARERQQKRFETYDKKYVGQSRTNSELSPRELEEIIPLSSSVRSTLEKAGGRLALSPRAFHRVVKVARTIADLNQSPDINDSHVLEALQYRQRKT